MYTANLKDFCEMLPIFVFLREDPLPPVPCALNPAQLSATPNRSWSFKQLIQPLFLIEVYWTTLWMTQVTEIHAEFFCGNLKERNHFEDLGVN